MNIHALSEALRTHASTLRDLALQSESATERDRDTVELIRVLARIVDGHPLQKAFGSPGDGD